MSTHRTLSQSLPSWGRIRLGAGTLALALWFTSLPLLAQSTQPTESDELALTQSKIADRYDRLEKLILRMAEFDQAGNPRRAELLKQAFALARERDIQLQLESASRMLEQEKLQRALDGQEQARRDLQALLELLLTENRTDRLKDEQARVRDYIREIERLERMQRSVQARTEGGVEPRQLQGEQQKVADDTKSLFDSIQDNERADAALGDDSDADLAEPSDTANEEDPAKAADESPANPLRNGADPRSESNTPNNRLRPGTEGGEDQPSPADESQPPLDGSSPTSESGREPSSDDSTPSDSSSEALPSDSPSLDKQPPGKPSSGQPSPGAPTDSSSQGDAADESSAEGDDGAPQEQSDFPGSRKVQQAEQKMRDAQQKLAEAKRDGAIEDQQEAARKLAEAKAELEKILRQMREEEIERVLAALEVRFRKMLEMQLRVYEETIRVHKISTSDRDRYADIEAGKLSFQERRIVVEADKCLAVLREEGSSVAFPESTQQIRDDMQQVVDLLAGGDVGRLTQGLEEDIIEALEEMVQALEKAQADQQQRRENPQSMPGAQPGDMPLVDAIAELKMLKSLQIRINRRTTRYATLLDDIEDPVGRPSDESLLRAVQELADHQDRLHQITRDISIGKNQ